MPRNQSPPFKHPIFGFDEDESKDKFVDYEEPDEIPENGTHFAGHGVLFGHDRPNMVSGHGEKSGGLPIVPLKQTRG